MKAKCMKAITAALCGAVLAGVAAPAASANTGWGSPWFVTDGKGYRWGLKWIDPGEAIAMPVTGPGSFEEEYMVIPNPGGGFIVAPQIGEDGKSKGSESRANDLSAALNASAASVPTPNGPKLSSPNRPVVPATLTTTTDCWATLPVTVGQLAGRAAGSTPATLVIDWGDNSPPTTIQTTIGATHQVTHQWRTGAENAVAVQELGAGYTRYVHGVSVQVVVGGESFYNGVFVNHTYYDPDWAINGGVS